ncbi:MULTISPECIES: hypothetical protein [unclassified Flavobacterium]|uniref:hypothetical protein n=1 Tax=unclassified Flavobacterium TaxID=196869 RepID=UPI0009660AC9|nr:MULTISPECIES: hypothetical protein [unclassified Flavobacterium]MBN9284188.1 hypothetical protein [Flavobacterium sp.]OJV70727.1 MAG: hypothetical protein BGO42_14530 [Flavobacterium sp. 40-81]
MKTIKKAFILLLLIAGGNELYSQDYRFITTGVSVSEKDKKGKWSDYTDFKKAEIIVNLNTDKNRIMIYSNVEQLFRIVEYYDKKSTPTDDIASFQCVTNDGENCVVSIYTRKNQGNRKQLYIYYKDRIIVYNMKYLKN